MMGHHTWEKGSAMPWTEADSLLYQELAAVAVPERVEQMAALLTLLPFAPDEVGRVVELACGEGRLTQALLDAFPHATALALDGSEAMRAQARARLQRFGERAEVAGFALGGEAWWGLVAGADAVVSSLAVHHLAGAHKQRLFAAMARRLSERGALLLADLVQPVRAEAEELFATGWDRAARHQARQAPGTARALAEFLRTRWNIFRYPDPMDMPSPVFDQLCWLRDAGFVSVDCFWLRAGHAVYGGYRAARRAGGPPLGFEAALASAQRAVGS
jgi:tRNA (cmo5U34)-methyltransferase